MLTVISVALGSVQPIKAGTVKTTTWPSPDQVEPIAFRLIADLARIVVQHPFDVLPGRLLVHARPVLREHLHRAVKGRGAVKFPQKRLVVRRADEQVQVVRHGRSSLVSLGGGPDDSDRSSGVLWHRCGRALDAASRRSIMVGRLEPARRRSVSLLV